MIGRCKRVSRSGITTHLSFMRPRGEDRGLFALQIIRDFGELGKGGLEVFDDFLGDDVGSGEIGAVF